MPFRSLSTNDTKFTLLGFEKFHLKHLNLRDIFIF